MKVTFLGVGEAFDENNTHTCILVEAAGRRMLVDCGATAPPSPAPVRSAASGGRARGRAPCATRGGAAAGAARRATSRTAAGARAP